MVYVDVKLDSDEQPRAEANSAEFLLRSEVIRLLSTLDQIHTGRITKLEVRAGIPKRVVFEKQAHPEGGLE